MAEIDKIADLIAENKFNDVILLIKKALIEQPDNVELMKYAGLAEVNTEQWEDAKKHFETVLKFTPEDATSWFYLASCYNNLGNYIAAKSAYKKVIELRHEYTEAYKSLCVLLLKLDLNAEAINYASQAKLYEPQDYIFDFIIGTAYLKSKEFDKSTLPLEMALNKDPKNVSIYNSLGTAYIATGQTEKAIDSYKKALELAPDSPMAYYNLGSVLQIKSDHLQACEYLKKAVEMDEEDESFRIAYAMSLVATKQYEQAKDMYKKLMIQHPEKENYKYNLITCYEAMGEIKTAISMLENIVYINSKFTKPAQKLASLYIKTNQLVKAKEIYDKFLLKKNPTAEDLHQYAILSSSLCDTDTAEKILKKVIKMSPDKAYAHKDLAIIYLNKRLFDYADLEFKEAMKLQPNDFEILFEYGNFLYSTSQNQEAERYYEEALLIEPNSALVLTFMALNKLILNQLDEAKKYILQALKINEQHEYIQFCAGRIFYALKEFENAKMYLIKSVEQNPDVETQNTLALTYYELGDCQQAVNIFENILSKFPENVSVLRSIAKCYDKLNNSDKALEYLDKLVDIFPDDEEAHEMIRKLS